MRKMSIKLFAETMGYFFAFSENAIQHFTTFKASIRSVSFQFFNVCRV
jgi:hypothetical protein